RLVAALPGLGRPGVKVADLGEDACVGGRVGPRCTSDGRLIDLDDLVEVLDTEDALVRPRCGLGAVQLLGQRRAQDTVHQGRLARARRSRDAREGPEWDGDVDVLEVVLACAFDDEVLAVAVPPLLRHGDTTVAAQVRGGERLLMVEEVGRGGCSDYPASVHAGSWVEVDDVVDRK